VTKPTGAKDTEVSLRGGYSIEWRAAGGTRRYAVVEVAAV